MPDHPATVILAAVGALVCAGLLLAQTGPADLAADLRETTDAILRDGPGAPCNPDKVVTHLVEIAVWIGKDGQLAAPLQLKLDAALARVKEGPALGDETRSVLGDAYAAFHEGRAFSSPTAVKTTDGARASIRAQVDHSLAALAAGRSSDAVGAVLEALMLIFTPMVAPA